MANIWAESGIIGQEQNQPFAAHRSERNIFCMSDNEKFEQVGRLAEEVSRLKGELNHINEKLTRAFFAYQFLTQGQSPGNWRVDNGKVVAPAAGRNQSQPLPQLEALLNEHELIEVIEKRQKLTLELQGATDRLKGLAPHLL